MKYNKLFDLQGKVAVVTGGAGLIGKELVRALAEVGATLIIAEIDSEKSRHIQKKLNGIGLNVIFKYMDIKKEKSIVDLIDFIDGKYGQMDIWVNNAYPKTPEWGRSFEYITFASWKKNVDMHLGGYFSCCQKAAEYMKKKRSGSIINFASIYGIVGPDFSIYKGTRLTMPAAYSAIKGGIITFTRYLASYYGEYNVRINCISPGGVYNKQPQAFVDRYVKKTPLKRMANVEDIAAAVIYLAADASSYVTGHNLVVDGGWSII